MKLSYICIYLIKTVKMKTNNIHINFSQWCQPYSGELGYVMDKF
jgi:hypothetical protein